MWFSSLDSTNYILVLSVLIILGVFALIVFGSLPCSCKYIVLMKYCFKRRSSRVGDSNRSHVIGGGMMDDPENTPRYPEVPFTIATTAENSSQFPQRMSIHTHINPFEIPTRELTFYSLSPTNLPYSPAYGQRDPMKQKWDEPPPPYEALFPIAVEELKDTQFKSKVLPAVPTPTTTQPSTEL